MTQQPHDLNIFKRWSIGGIQVTRVLEIPPLTSNPAAFIQTDRDEVAKHRAWLCPDFAEEDGSIQLHFQAFIIEAGGKRIMVDPCIGNHKPRGPKWMKMLDTDFLQRLEKAGFPRQDIDYVLCTHLHVDHCGWNTMLVDGEWIPTFPNARYLFAKAEFDHAEADRDGYAKCVFEESIKPIFDAGLADLVNPDHVIVEGVCLEATPGHTPGHCSVNISSEGQKAIITGDVLHHPVQVALPQVRSNFCWDHDMAAMTRRTLLERVSTHDALLLGSHFAGPTGVYLDRDGDAWKVRKPND